MLPEGDSGQRKEDILIKATCKCSPIPCAQLTLLSSVEPSDCWKAFTLSQVSFQRSGTWPSSISRLCTSWNKDGGGQDWSRLPAKSPLLEPAVPKPKSLTYFCLRLIGESKSNLFFFSCYGQRIKDFQSLKCRFMLNFK